MMRSFPIRVRLTLWYSLVLSVCLAAFGTTVWLGLQQSLRAARETELQQRMGSLRTVLQQFDDEPNSAAESLKEEVEEFVKGLPTDFSVRVLGPSHSVVFESESSRIGRVLEAEEVLEAGTRGLQIKMSISMEPVDEILRRLSHILYLTIPIALLAASSGGYWLSKRAMLPVREMAMAARSIDSTDLSLRLPVPAANDELRLLAGMWNEMLDRLQSGVERIQRFTSDASHDLRTPLATIRASAEIALRKRREPESYQDTLERIVQQTDRATTLVEDLLTLARTDSGCVDFVLTPLDLCLPLQDICDSLRPLVQGKNLELRHSLPPNPVWVNADANAVMRLIAILIDNALKNTEAGWIQVQLETAGREAILKVEDSGSGIGLADLPHIFDRFYRGDKSRTGVKGGSGLGLAIARRLVEFHQGTITSESILGQGTRFIVRLPRATAVPQRDSIL
ncbi:MAG: ATP-binding protein [Acidobacteriota bacterium]